MSNEYFYDPDSLNPWLAGLAAGAVGAIAGTVLAFLLQSPDEIVANSITVTVGALLIGLASGWLWRKVRATNNGLATFRFSLVGAFVVTLVAVAIVDQVALSRLIPYGVPIAVVIFVSVGLLTPYLAAHHWPVWTVVVLVLIALAMAVGLFGRGIVESGDLSLSDLTTTTLAPTANTQAESTETAGAAAAPVESFDEFVISTGTATWSVPETLQGLATVAVGRSETLTGTITPGGGFEFEIDLTTFTSDQPRRDAFVRDMFGGDPLATFTAEEFALPDAADGAVVMIQVPGTLTINGTPRAVIWEVEARKDGAVISVTGELDITLTEFGLTPPRLGFVQVEDEASLEVLFQADGR